MSPWFSRWFHRVPTTDPARVELDADPEQERRQQERALEGALGTVRSLLTEFGRQGFDVPGADQAQLQQQCEAWVSHLLTGAPHPTRPVSRAGSLTHRDWTGAARFFAGHRAEERQFVERMAEELRQTLLLLVQGLDAVFTQDEHADGRVRLELRRLRTVSQAASLDEIRRTVLSAVGEISKVAEERRREQQAEMARLHGRLDEMAVALEVARQEKDLDPLTNLANRGAFDARLTQAVQMAHVFGTPCCLLLLDLDHFKRVNDGHGHPAGDQVLRSVADALARTCRVKNDLAARVGGEEFGIILWGTVEERAVRAAERVLQAVRALRIPCGNLVLEITTSIGVAEVGVGEAAEDWFARADRALYAAKQAGRDQLQLAPPVPERSSGRCGVAAGAA